GGGNPTGASITSGTLRNNGLDYGGIQIAPSLEPGTRGEAIAHDLNIKMELLVPTDGGGLITQAGPYFRSRAAAAGDGIIGGTSAGYWVSLYGTGEVKIRVLNGKPDNPWIAASKSPRGFNANSFHTLEMAAAGRDREVALDER